MNKDFISNNLCINLDEPVKMCFGSCFLEDSLQDNESDSSDFPNSIEKKTSNSFYTLNADDVISKRIAINLQDSLIPFFRDNYSFKFSQDIFHPPQFT